VAWASAKLDAHDVVPVYHAGLNSHQCSSRWCHSVSPRTRASAKRLPVRVPEPHRSRCSAQARMAEIDRTFVGTSGAAAAVLRMTARAASAPEVKRGQSRN